MSYKTNHALKKLTWRKAVAIIGVVVATFAIVVGVYSTSLWAGTGLNYQGNEIARALPVTKGSSQGGDSQANSDTSYGNRHGVGIATVFVKDNVASSSSTNTSKLEHLDAEGGAVNVVQNTSYPQTGDNFNYASLFLGVTMLLGLAFVYRKRFSVFVKK